MRYLYSLLLYLIAPLILLYLKKRTRQNPEYALYWNERFGYGLINKSQKPIIWLHAVSVGETRALAKLIELLSRDYPTYQILITQMTPTGRYTAKNLYPNTILHYIPYDLPHSIINFYTTFKPRLGLIMETEIWPNLIHYAKQYKVPLFLINARLSMRSFQSYHRIKWLIRPVINQLSGILAQDNLTADNFFNLGFKRQLKIIGNTKFDITIAKKDFTLATWLKQNLVDKKIVVFASTRDYEEKLILENIPPNFPYLIVIIPRHPERFNEVEHLIQATGLNYEKRSQNNPIAKDTHIFLGNSLGEMFAYYALADLAIVGGSFVNQGGQNLIEPLYLNVPVIFGQSMFNFTKIAHDALQINCAIQVTTLNECFNKITEIFTNIIMYTKLKSNCTPFINQYQGASQKIIDTIKYFL